MSKWLEPLTWINDFNINQIMLVF